MAKPPLTLIFWLVTKAASSESCPGYGPVRSSGSAGGMTGVQTVRAWPINHAPTPLYSGWSHSGRLQAQVKPTTAASVVMSQAVADSAHLYL